MEFPQRKRQRLRGFDYSSPGVYFITQCIKDGADILGNVCVGDGVPYKSGNSKIDVHIETICESFLRQRYIPAFLS